MLLSSVTKLTVITSLLTMQLFTYKQNTNSHLGTHGNLTGLQLWLFFQLPNIRNAGHIFRLPHFYLYHAIWPDFLLHHGVLTIYVQPASLVSMLWLGFQATQCCFWSVKRTLPNAARNCYLLSSGLCNNTIKSTLQLFSYKCFLILVLLPRFSVYIVKFAYSICDQIYKNQSKSHIWQVTLFITNQVL